MYIYTTKGRQLSPLSTLVPYNPARPLLPQGMGTNGDQVTQTASMVTDQATRFNFWVKVALAMAVGAVGFALYNKLRSEPMYPNMLAPWPAIGPTFAYADGIGRAFSLVPFVV